MAVDVISAFSDHGAYGPIAWPYCSERGFFHEKQIHTAQAREDRREDTEFVMDLGQH
jgi:hypothetical protein